MKEEVVLMLSELRLQIDDTIDVLRKKVPQESKKSCLRWMNMNISY